MFFSKRNKYTPAFKNIQIESIDEELRNRLWNALDLCYWKNFSSFSRSNPNRISNSNLMGLLIKYWDSFYKLPIDTMPFNFSNALKFIKREFFNFKWYRVYDFIEFTIHNSDYINEHSFAEHFIKLCNQLLEEENSAYRIVNNQFVQITSQTELESINKAVENAKEFPGVYAHLDSSIALLADRENPNYRNSIKESISAVEAICQLFAGDRNADLGKALRILGEKKNVHPALQEGFQKIYGYTSDADGIRHAMLEESTVSFVDAKFMLVACTAFINYLIGKAAEIGIEIHEDLPT